MNSQFQKAQKLCEERKYLETLDVLNSIDESKIDKGSTFWGEYCILIGFTSLILGKYENSFPLNALEFYSNQKTSVNYAESLYLRGWQYQQLGKIEEAKKYLSLAYNSSIKYKHYRIVRNVSNRLAYIALRFDCFEKAISYATINLEYCRILENKDSIIRGENNLALFYFRAGFIDKSISLYKKNAIVVLKMDDQTKYVYYLGYALALALKGKIEDSYKKIAEIELLENLSNYHKMIYYQFYGNILLLDNDIEKGIKFLKKGLTVNSKSASVLDMETTVKRLLGDAYLLSGDYDNAKSHTTKALQVAEKINERIEIAACYRIFAQLEQHNGNNDKAKDNFEKAFTIFNNIKSNYELAVTRFIASQTDTFNANEKNAMLHLALEYFESENITHYVDKVQRELQRLKNIIGTKKSTVTNTKFICPDVITVDSKMVKILDHTKHIAKSEMSILLTGETGTGKEIMARYIHYHSERNDNFVAVNSSAFPNEMFESELFGYKKGAFTGAKDDKPGLFEMAEGGTFFLDEIGDINLESQAKLLRVLDQKSYRRLGENKTRKVNFRLIAATNRNLEQMIKDNLFRPDLYFRLKEIEISLPPLRDRKSDIPALVEYFLQSFGFKVNGDVLIVEQLATILSEHNWDGNIRELRNELKRLYLFADKSIEKMIELVDKQQPLSESKQLLSLLKETNWNRRETARILGVSEGAIRKRILKYNLIELSKL